MMLEVKTAVILRKERKRSDYESPKGFWDSGNVLSLTLVSIRIVLLLLFRELSIYNVFTSVLCYSLTLKFHCAMKRLSNRGNGKR